jgi:hypothetical protein
MRYVGNIVIFLIFVVPNGSHQGIGRAQSRPEAAYSRQPCLNALSYVAQAPGLSLSTGQSERKRARQTGKLKLMSDPSQNESYVTL